MPNNLSNRMIRTILFKRDGNRCAYCREILSHRSATIDHVFPVSRGGAMGSLVNLVLACEPCNREKGSLPLKRYLRGRKVVFLENRVIRWGLASGLGGGEPGRFRPENQGGWVA